MAKPFYEDEVLGKAFDARLTKKAFVFVKPYKRQLAVALVAMLATAGLGLVTPKLMKIAIDDGMGKKDMRVLTIVAIAFIVNHLIRWMAQRAQTLAIANLGQNVLYDIRHSVFSHLQNLSLSFFDTREVGRIIARLTSDVDALNELLTSGVLSVVTDVLMVFGIVYILFSENAELTWVVLAVIPPMYVVTAVFRGKSRTAYRDVRKKVATVTATVAENVSGVRVVKSFSREKENLRRFKQINRENRDAYMHAAAVGAIFGPAITIVSSIGICSVFWYGGVKVITGALTVGIVYEFLRYMEQFFIPIRDMSGIYQTMQSAMAGAERIFEILDTPADVNDRQEAVEMPAIRGDVTFRDVGFGYGEVPVLKSVSVDIQAGQTVALVGPTGAGKTTIINLLSRQYDIQSGSILIDGQDIRDVTMRSLRRQMGVVLQDPFLFPGSVIDNIRYGRLDATDQAVYEAAKAVGAHDFITELPEGYGTDVREGGSKLSSGQKQLISFARALLADPRILILDEATSSVDTQTEMLIQEALRKLLKGRTSFVIAHRLSTIVEADMILAIDGGRIVERGTHQELLMNDDGLYRKLYDMQFEYASDDEHAMEAG